MLEAYQELEETVAKVFGAKNVVSCATGTAALHLAFESLMIPRGSKVVMPDFNMIACPRAATLAGLEPVFVDCCAHDLLVNLGMLERALRKDEFYQIKAVLVVHIYGRRVNVYKIMSLLHQLNRPDIHIIEDLAECHYFRPSKYVSASCWSFYKNKIVGGEEGGAVAFKESAPSHIARSLRSLGFDDNHDFMHIPRGHNYRMSNAHASLILDSFRNYANELHWRRVAEACYEEYLPAIYKMPYRYSPWVYDIHLPWLTYHRQTRLVGKLRESGVQARHAFKPMSMQEEYKRCATHSNCRSRSHEMSERVIYLPLKMWNGFDYWPEEKVREFCKSAIDMILEFC